MENYEKKYKEALGRARELQENSNGMILKKWLWGVFPELKESEDERIRKALKQGFFEYGNSFTTFGGIQVGDILAWLEKQGEIDLEHYKDGENEKRKFVGYGFLKCKGDFLSFKEGETYWLEYVGKDNYNVRSDNLLGQTFHIKPIELYTVFRPTTWLEKQRENKHIDEVEPKFKVGDTMRTWREAANGYTDGMPVVVSIDNEYYHCTNELIAIKDQDNYEFPPINVKQKSSDKVEPKFKVGDWITNGCLTCKVLGVTGNSYELHLHNDDYCHFETDIQSVNKYYHLWAIQDAKDGDVLTTDNFIFIFKSIDNSNGVHYYCHYEISKHEDDSPRFGIALSQSLMGIVGGTFTHYKPATKEQCDLLFQKMKEAGYVWDANKKELKKIEDEKLMRELN